MVCSNCFSALIVVDARSLGQRQRVPQHAINLEEALGGGTPNVTPPPKQFIRPSFATLVDPQETAQSTSSAGELKVDPETPKESPSVPVAVSSQSEESHVESHAEQKASSESAVVSEAAAPAPAVAETAPAAVAEAAEEVERGEMLDYTYVASPSRAESFNTAMPDADDSPPARRQQPTPPKMRRPSITVDTKTHLGVPPQLTKDIKPTKTAVTRIPGLGRDTAGTRAAAAEDSPRGALQTSSGPDPAIEAPEVALKLQKGTVYVAGEMVRCGSHIIRCRICANFLCRFTVPCLCCSRWDRVRLKLVCSCLAKRQLSQTTKCLIRCLARRLRSVRPSLLVLFVCSQRLIISQNADAVSLLTRAAIYPLCYSSRRRKGVWTDTCF